MGSRSRIGFRAGTGYASGSGRGGARGCGGPVLLVCCIAGGPTGEVLTLLGEGPDGVTGERDVELFACGMSPGASARTGWPSFCVETSTCAFFCPGFVVIVVVVVVVVVTTT